MTEKITVEQWRQMKQKRNKYGAKKVKLGGESFDSKGEFYRWESLQWLEQAGQIQGLGRQHKFPIKVAGVHICTYVMDFVYIEGGRKIAEDFKGKATPLNKLKQKLFKALYPELTLRITTKEDLGFITLENTVLLVVSSVLCLVLWSMRQ